MPRPIPCSRNGGRNEQYTPKQPAIARIWRGQVRRARADEYEAYNYDMGITPLIELPKSVEVFRLLKSHGRTGAS